MKNRPYKKVRVTVEALRDILVGIAGLPKDTTITSIRHDQDRDTVTFKLRSAEFDDIPEGNEIEEIDFYADKVEAYLRKMLKLSTVG